MIAVALVAGIAIGWLSHYRFDTGNHAVRVRNFELRSKYVSSSRFTFINPLLQCEESEEVFSELRPFKEELVAKVEQLKAEGLAEEIAVYFRDLNNGPWIGIKERDNYQPASLLKVPMMMGVLKLAESDPSLLKKKVTYDGPMDLHQNMPPGIGLEAGKRYTILEILFSLIEHSDNRAVWMLDKLYGQKSLRDPVFRELGIPSMEDSPNMEISMKNYSSFFRVLYNASYLNREMSDMALHILSSSEMKGALAGGVPASVTVAHKFGRMNLNPRRPQMHDCGIIYYPDHPYLLCVMTRGDDVGKLTTAIREISGFVYNTVSAQLIKHGDGIRSGSDK